MSGYTTAMRRYFEVSGRSNRSEYWMFVLIYFLIGVVATVIDFAVLGHGFEDNPGILGGIVGLVHFIPAITVGIRRLHDTDRSGWWLLIVLIPIIGSIWLIVLFCFEGTLGNNRFGPRPNLLT